MQVQVAPLFGDNAGALQVQSGRVPGAQCDCRATARRANHVTQVRRMSVTLVEPGPGVAALRLGLAVRAVDLVAQPYPGLLGPYSARRRSASSLLQGP